MKTRLNRTYIISLFLISILLSIGGWYISSKSTFQYSRYPFYFSGISKDGWTGKTFNLDLKDALPKEGGVLGLQFSFWRPGNVDALTHLKAFLCDKVYEFNVQSASSAFSLEVPSYNECSQRQVTIEAIPSFFTQDKRELGVKILKASIRPFFTALSARSIGIASLLIFCVSLLVTISFNLTTVIFFLITSLWVVAHQHWDVEQEFYFFFILIGVVCIGTFVKFNEDLQGLSPRILYTILFFVVLGGCIIRIQGLSFGLPHFFHPDETRKGRIALKFLQSGDFNPDYFLHPTLLLYLTALMGKIRSVLFGFEPVVQDMVFSGRLVSCIAGVCSILFSFEIGKRVFSKEAGLVTAALVAYSPLTITCSRYLKEDSLMLSFLLLSIVLALWGKERKCFYGIAFFLAGVSMSAKYSGLLSMVPIFIITFIFDREYLIQNKRKFILLSSFMVVGFLCCSPFIVINYSKFIEDFLSEGKHMVDGHHDVVISPFAHFFLFHLTRSVIPAFGGSFIAYISVFSFFLMFGTLLKKPSTSLFLVAILTALFYFPGELVNAKPPPQPERYILPSIPFFALGASYVLTRIRGGLLVSLCLISFLAFKSAVFASTLIPDTREVMGEWIIKNIPPHTTIAIDALPYTPLLPETYEVKNLGAFEERRAISSETLREQGVQYLLLTSLSFDRYFNTRNSDQVVKERFKDIFSSFPLVHEVLPEHGTYAFHNPRLYLYKVPTAP